MQYPATRRDETVVETLHGVDVADPYRWLEASDSAEVADWVRAQQALTAAHLGALPAHGLFREHLTRIWDHPKVGAPWRRGPHWFQLRNSGLQEQPVLWTMSQPAQPGRVLLDPATLSEDGTVSLVGTAVSDDGALLAYGTSDGGSDWTTWRVREVGTGADRPDLVEWSKFSGAAWAPDGSGFYYGAFDPPAAGQELSAANRHMQLRFHRLGDEGPDQVVYRREDQPEWGFSPQVTEDGRWLVVTVSHGTDPRTRLYLAGLDGTRPQEVLVSPWLDDFDGEYDLVGSTGDTLLVQTDAGSPNGRVIAVAAHDPRDLVEVVAEQDEPLVLARLLGDRLLCLRLVDAVHRLTLHELDGTLVARLDLPELASVGELTGRAADDVAHLAVSSYTRSASICRLDLRDHTVTEIRPPDVELTSVRTERVLVDSTGGARVPLFLVRPADARRDGRLPVILYGYGGFGIPLSPEFRLWWSAWLAHGGAIAIGCYRGGAEYGRAWHDAGRLRNKRRTFEDALSCAHWLAESGWSAPEHIGITGGSNGGLTTMAAVIADPAAFGAAVPEVGVLDLLRFHRFTIGWAWTSDYGDPDDPEDFPLLHAMSPLHTLTDGACYPPTLITTADRDDRVVPAHSFKFTAAMQRAQGCDNPILARIDTRAGHGAGTPTSKLIQARADVLTFLAHHLGLELEGSS